MINLYELKVMDRLCNMLFKMPNFTKINNTSDTEFLKYSIAVDCGFTVEDSEIGYMDKIFDLFRNSVGKTCEGNDFKYTIQDFKSFVVTPAIEDLEDDLHFDDNMIMNINLLHIMVHDKIGDKYKYYLIPFIINKSVAYTIKNAYRLLDPPTLDIKIDDIVELIDFEKANFLNQIYDEHNLAEHICLNPNLEIRDNDIKMGMTYHSLGSFYHVIEIDGMDSEDPVKKAIYDSNFASVLNKLKDANADRFVPLINIESIETFKINEYACYNDGSIIMSRSMNDAQDNDMIITLNTRVQGYRNFEFDELDTDEIMYKGCIFKRKIELTKSESNTIIKQNTFLKDTSFESYTLSCNGLTYLKNDVYADMHKRSESIIENAKDGIKNSLKDIALGMKNKITKAKMDLYFSSLNKHLSTVIGTGALLTGGFGIGIAIFLYKAIKKIFMMTPMGEEAAIDNLKKMSIKMDDILEELDESLSRAESEKRYYDIKKIKKSIRYYNKIKDMLERKMIDVRTMKVGLGGDGL